MEIIAKLGSLMGLSFIAGVNLYATVAVVGLCLKYQVVQGLPPELYPLANDAVIFIALVLYSLEFLADKVPGLDTLWDSIHTLIRPLGGAMLALMQVGEASPALEVIVFMLGASLASASHLTKAGTRLIVNASPEPFSNVLLSVGEDIGTVGFSYLSLAYPKLSFFLTLGLLGLIAFLLPLILRTMRLFFSALFFRVKSTFQGGSAQSSILPIQFDTFFEGQKSPSENVLWVGKGYAIKIPGIPKFTSLWAVVTTETVYFLYRRRFRIQAQQFARSELRMDRCYPGTLLGKWLLRTSRTDWIIYLYQPLSQTLPRGLAQGNAVT